MLAHTGVVKRGASTYWGSERFCTWPIHGAVFSQFEAINACYGHYVGTQSQLMQDIVTNASSCSLVIANQNTLTRRVPAEIPVAIVNKLLHLKRS